MRPVSLHMEGFGAFREAVDISFDGVDYFALVGPTGAGKSTVVDAICFALYGSIPRYGDERLVGRAVSAGKQEAKVSLTFDIAERRYRATRVVRVRNGKASTPEALLERVVGDDDSELLANSARDMKPAVEALLGLPFAHFTKCVVLPQGDFARFLHDEPAKRRELLSRLLDFQVYERVGQRARERAAEANGAVGLYTQQLADVAFATEAAQHAAHARRDALRDLYKQLDAAATADERDAAAITALEGEHERARTIADALSRVVAPAELTALGDNFELVHAEADAAAREREDAAAALATLDAHITSLGDVAPLLQARDAHERAAKLRVDGARAAETATHAADALDAASAAVEHAERQAQVADDALSAQRDAHAAHALAAHLVAGEPCPVCAQEVRAVPKRKKPAALSTAEKAQKAARTEVTKLRARLAEATSAAASAAATNDQLTAQLADVAPLLEAAPDREALAAAIEAHQLAATEHNAARERDRAGREREATARAALTAFDEQRDQLRESLQRVRDIFVAHGLEPPRPAGNVDRDWSSFTAWAVTAREEQDSVIATFEAQLAQAHDRRAERVREYATTCRALDVIASTASLRELRDAVHDAGTTTAAELRRIEDALERAGKANEQLAAAKEEHDVAALLGSLMRSNRFENWLLAEAVERLAEAASATLFTLSDGHFSLSYTDDSEFDVIDHRNAGERRSVRTLSGGETFQASLALALALREQLAEVSTAGDAKLDALFLDEGFGTLDADSLETVANTIEALGADGGMVGVVTHVPSLAERVPVRFRVEHTDLGARVTREEL